jgi:hypothetical protein
MRRNAVSADPRSFSCRSLRARNALILNGAVFIRLPFVLPAEWFCGEIKSYAQCTPSAIGPKALSVTLRTKGDDGGRVACPIRYMLTVGMCLALLAFTIYFPEMQAE